MSLSILNNPASLAAQNQLGMTNSSLQSTLFQLASGTRINSGADDAAGLAIADGLHANITSSYTILAQCARWCWQTAGRGRRVIAGHHALESLRNAGHRVSQRYSFGYATHRNSG